MVEVSWDALPGRIWTGHTESIPRQVVARGYARNVGEVLCSISNDEMQLILNTTVDVRILLRMHPNVLTVPRGAVQIDGARRYVFLVADGRLHRTEIKVGIANATDYEVVSGVQERRHRCASRRHAAQGRSGRSRGFSGMKRITTLSGTLLIASLACGLPSGAVARPLPVPARVPAVTPLATSSELPSEIRKLYDTGHYREAVEALEAAIAGNQQDPRLQYWLGRCFYELRDYGRAVSSFERATALDPNQSEYHDWPG